MIPSLFMDTNNSLIIQVDFYGRGEHIVLLCSLRRNSKSTAIPKVFSL